MTPDLPPLRVLVVDDSSLYRKVVRDVIASIPDVEVVATAHNGRVALEKIIDLRPDVVTLDLEMPELDGLGVLREISDRKLNVAAIMVSAFTAKGAETTTTALRQGALDFVLKPNGSSFDENAARLRADIEPKLLACRTRLGSRRGALVGVGAVGAPHAAPTGSSSTPSNRPSRPFRVGKPQIIGIGISTGGPQALTKLIPALPGDLGCPIVIVQHMPPMFTKSLADDLNRQSRLTVYEAQHGQIVRPGEVLVAPGGKQMKLVRQLDAVTVQITDDPPERNCKPAVNYLFRSIAEAYGSRALGVVMTGMGDDGTEGCRDLRTAGSRTIAQDESTCVVWGMPRAVTEAGYADAVVPLDKLASALTSLVRSGTLP